MEAEADRMAPRETGGRETGGILLGWSSPDGDDHVVAEMIGPGPNATHWRTRFRPDGLWQERRLAERYKSSGRRLTYLGDWHSHPRGSDHPSKRDIRTARKIAAHEEARASQPLMLILAGEGDGWCLVAYRLENGRLMEIANVGATELPTSRASRALGTQAR
jgi:integrative and conjugative element protein (TIGR02256 family)